MQRSRSVLFAVLALSAIVTLMAFLAFRSTAQSRSELRERFAARAFVASRFLEAYVTELAEQQRADAEEHLASDVDRSAFADLVRRSAMDAAVLLDARGRLLAVHPHRPEILGDAIAKDYEHLARAVAGEVGVSGVVPSAAEGVPLVAIATPFDGADGRRVFSGGHTVEHTPLRAYVSNVSPIAGTRAYIVDRAGAIVAGGSKGTFRRLADVEPELAQTLARGSASTYEGPDGARFVATTAVDGTPWTIVLSVPQETLYQPLAGTATWLPWAMVMALAATAVLLGLLFVRLNRQRVELTSSLAEQERLSHALNEFSGRVAHDLRSPLTAAKGWAEIAESNPELAEEARGTIRRSIDRAVVLIDDLLAFAHGSAKLSLEDVDLPALVRDVTSDVQDAVITVDGLPNVVVADRVALARAIENLVQNAARYGRTNGVADVTISGREVPGGWRIEVADRGPGVPAAEAEAIFEAFKRGIGSKTPGTGLGLAIVASLVNSHHGRVWYEPRDGGGSVFVIEIPRPATGRASGGS